MQRETSQESIFLWSTLQVPANNEESSSIIFECVKGGTISSLIDKYGKFNETLIRVYVKQILEGLEYLHARNTIHRGNPMDFRAIVMYGIKISKEPTCLLTIQVFVN